MKKRLLSLLLTAAMLIPCVSMSFTAASAQQTDSATSSEVTSETQVTGTNSFGELLADGLTDTDGEDTDTETDTDTEYAEDCGISDITVEGNTATVTYYTAQDCTVVVALYDEDSGEMLASGYADVVETDDVATVEVGLDTESGTEEMPEYFDLKGFMLDSENNPIANDYSTNLYTETIQYIKNITVNDFDSDDVLNLDEDEETNFAVYSDTAVVIEYAEGYNIPDSVTAVDSTYTFTNATDEMKNLSVGDYVVYTYGDDVILFKVAAISVDGDTVTITTEDDLSLASFFDIVKIDVTDYYENAEYSSDDADESVTFEGVESNGSTQLSSGVYSSGAEETLTVPEYTYKFKIDASIKSEDGDKNDVSTVISDKVSATLKITPSFSLSYYIYTGWNPITAYNELKDAYVSVSLTGKVEVDGTIEAAVSERIKLGELGVSPIAGLYLDFTPQILIEAKGSIEIKATVTQNASFVCNLDGITDTSTPTTADCECELKLELFTGIDFGPQLKVLGLDCAKIDLDLVVGFKVTASDTLFDVGTKSKHLCTGCVSGNLYGEFRFSIKVIFKISDKLDLSLTPVSFTKDFYIFQFYWSQTFSDFGYSFSTDKLECPHVAYHTTAYVYDSDHNLAENVAITLYKNGSTEAINFGTTDSSGTVTGYLETGTYKWETNGCTGTFTIKEDYNTVMIMLTEPEEDDAEEDDSGTSTDTQTDTGNNTSTDTSIDILTDTYCDADIYYYYWTPEVNGAWPGIEMTAAPEVGENVYKCTVPKSTTTIIFSSYVDGEESMYQTVNINTEGYISGESDIWDAAGLESDNFDGMIYVLGSGDDYVTTSDYSGAAVVGGEWFSLDENSAIYYKNTSADWYETFYGSYIITTNVTEDENTDIDNETDTDTSTNFNSDVSTDTYTYYFAVPSTWLDSNGLSNQEKDNVATHEDETTNMVDSGICGSALYWELYASGTLYIYGSGGMNNYSSYSPAPWYDIRSSVANVVIESSVTSIGNRAFYNCDNLSSVTMSNKVTSIGKQAFFACTSLTSVVIPKKVSSIGFEAFAGCGSLTSVTIGYSVTEIVGSTFSYCTSLTSITIPNSVTRINLYAFFGCGSLTDVYYTGTEEQWNSISIGSYNSSLTSATIHYNYATSSSTKPVSELSSAQFAPATSDTTTRTAQFTGLSSGEEYIVMVVRSADVERLYTNDNLIYINQYTADDDGTLEFSYASDYSGEPIILAFGAEQDTGTDSDTDTDTSTDVDSDTDTSADASTSTFFFDAGDWYNGVEVIYFYIWKIDADGNVQYGTCNGWVDSNPWGSKKLMGTDLGNGIWQSYELELNDTDNIFVIFVNNTTGAQTYDCVINTNAIGQTAYMTGNTMENPIDSDKTCIEATFDVDGCGSYRQITSTGNVVGSVSAPLDNPALQVATFAVQYAGVTNKTTNALTVTEDSLTSLISTFGTTAADALAQVDTAAEQLGKETATADKIATAKELLAALADIDTDTSTDVDSDTDISSDTDSDTSTDSDTYTYYFVVPGSWLKDGATICHYYWTPQENGAWPGVEMTAAPEVGENVYKCTVPKATTTIIFSSSVDGEESMFQTVNINTEGYISGESDIWDAYGLESDDFNGMIYVLGSGEDYVTINDYSGATTTAGEWFSLDESSPIYYKNTDADWYDTFYGSYTFANDTDTSTDSDTAADVDTDTSTDTNTDSAADSDSDIDTTADSDTDSDTDTSTDSDIDTDTSSDTSTDSDSDTSTDSDTDSDTSTDSDSDTSTDSDEDSDTTTDTDTDTDTTTVTLLMGDVNGDGTINSVDALLTLRCASALTDFTDEQQFAADVNTDGKVNSVDALAILRYSAGLSTDGTCGESVEYVA